MGALIGGLRIGVCCQDRTAALTFMNSTFNKPEAVQSLENTLTYMYDGGDMVEWIRPKESIRGRRFDLIFCDESLDDVFKDCILRPMRTFQQHRIYWMLEQFNEEQDVKFELVR